MRNLNSTGNSDRLLIMLSISGGGYRVAALGYGVLKALRDTPIDWEGRHATMLDELNFINSVS